MTVLVLGPKGSGKTHLLTSLQSNSINLTSHSVPTIGTNIFTLRLPCGKETDGGTHRKHKVVHLREIGGEMAPLWRTYYHNVDKIIYVVDTSNLCQISAAGVLFFSILTEPRLQHVKVLIALTKMDLAYRQMRNEALLMLQIEKLKASVSQTIEIVETSAISTQGFDTIKQWILKSG